MPKIRSSLPCLSKRWFLISGNRISRLLIHSPTVCPVTSHVSAPQLNSCSTDGNLTLTLISSVNALLSIKALNNQVKGLAKQQPPWSLIKILDPYCPSFVTTPVYYIRKTSPSVASTRIFSPSLITIVASRVFDTTGISYSLP